MPFCLNKNNRAKRGVVILLRRISPLDEKDSGAWLSLVERSVRDAEADSSSLSAPTFVGTQEQGGILCLRKF